MTDKYIVPLRRPPKNPSSGKKKTQLGLRREVALIEWEAHAVEEHGWGTRDDSMAKIMSCPACADYVGMLKKSEEWR